MKRLLLFPMVLGLSFGVPSVATAATPTCPPAIDAADYTVDGTFDVDAYLAALAAALEACDGDIPQTGNSDFSQVLTLAVGISSVGLIVAVPAIRRRRAA